MTDQPVSSAPDDAVDELVSAVIDGEADGEEAARVDADPQLAARRDELQRVAARVATPVTGLDELTAQRLRRSALDAALGASTTAVPARRRPVRTAWLVASAAVVVLLALVAVPLLGNLSESGDQSADVASTAADDGGAAELAGSDAALDSDEGEALDEATSPTDVDLGEFADDQDAGDAAVHPQDRAGVEALAPSSNMSADSGESAPSDDAAEDRSGDESDLADEPEEAPETSPLIERADEACEIEANDLPLVAEFVATVHGEVRLVHVHRHPDGSLQAEVIDPATCEVLAVVEE